jgi:hypothetical protein
LKNTVLSEFSNKLIEGKKFLSQNKIFD